MAVYAFLSGLTTVGTGRLWFYPLKHCMHILGNAELVLTVPQMVKEAVVVATLFRGLIFFVLVPMITLAPRGRFNRQAELLSVADGHTSI